MFQNAPFDLSVFALGRPLPPPPPPSPTIAVPVEVMVEEVQELLLA
jgi:hypothetical protein